MSFGNAFGSPFQLIGWGPGWVVVDKPAGITVHNDPGHDLCSRLSDFLSSSMDIGRAICLSPEYGLHPAHRLDKETSGLLLLACHREALDHFAKLMSSRKFRKEYLALVHGQLEIHVPATWGLWEWPLTRGAAGRRHPQGSGKRVACKTRFAVRQTSPRYSLLQCRLLTGRRHQIRRHAALAGHPVVGDRRYGAKRACRYLEQNFNFTRLGLHSAVLEFSLPSDGTVMRFELEKLPNAIRHVLDADLAKREV
jgi:RluA family pseudouridine synthase